MAEGLGVLLTYHPNLGLREAITRHLVRQNASPDKIVQVMRRAIVF